MQPLSKLNTQIRGLHTSDSGLTLLTFVQCVTMFFAVPVVAMHVADRWLLDSCLLVFAVICAFVFTERRSIQAALLSCLLVIVLGPSIGVRFMTGFTNNAQLAHETISFVAFCFNLLATGLVARHVFGEGRVTGHKVLGAVLIYLNVAVLFSIAYDMVDTYVGGAIKSTTGGLIMTGGARVAELSYFSLTTITTCGYGDLVPVHPLARSLANLEAIFGALFPATFVARLVALHLAHSEDRKH